MYKIKRLFPVFLALSLFWSNNSLADETCYYKSHVDNNNFYNWTTISNNGVQAYTCFFGNATLVSLTCDDGYAPNKDLVCRQQNAASTTLVNIEAEAYGGGAAKVYLNGSVVCRITSGGYFDSKRTCKVNVATASGVEFDLQINADTGGWGNGCDAEVGDTCILNLDGTERTIGFDAHTEPDD